MIKFPKELPRPQRDDYELGQVNRIMRTPMQSGRAVERIEFDDVPTLPTMSFIFTHVEARLFDSFVKLVGADYFLFDLYCPLGYAVETECRFIKSPEKQTPIGVTHWRYPVALEVKEKPELPPEWAELLPTFVLYPDIFDLAINVEKPE